MPAIGDTFLPCTEYVVLPTGAEANGRPTLAGDLAGAVDRASGFILLGDARTPEGWPDLPMARLLSTLDWEDSGGTVGLAHRATSSFAGDGYVEILKGEGREPLGLAGRSLRRLARYSAARSYLALLQALLGEVCGGGAALTFLLVGHKGRLGRRDLPLEVSKVCHLVQHLGDSVGVLLERNQKRYFAAD